MIKYVEGDILHTGAKVIAHGIAPMDDFKNGLALSLRERWPAMYKDLRHFCHETSPKAGTIWVWTGSDGSRIVNLFTQEPAPHQGGHAGPAHLDFVNRSLKALREWIVTEKVPSVALPRLATGVGKLDWEQVSPIIERHLADLSIPIYVYSTFKKGVTANEV